MVVNLKKDIKPLSLFRTQPSQILKQARDSKRPVIITDRGKPTAVLLDLEEFERQKEKTELMEAVIEGERDIQNGNLVSLDEVFKQTRRWLPKKP